MINESIDDLNKRLVDYYGIAWNGWPIYRIVFSDDQLEKRLMEYTDSGIALIQPEVREVPKYRQWIQHKYLLENLVVVPEENQKELCSKVSYEPLFVFEDGRGFPLPPSWLASQFVINSVIAATGKQSFAKYKESYDELSEEGRLEKLNKLQEELFGNETEVGDALAHKEGVTVPSNFKPSIDSTSQKVH